MRRFTFFALTCAFVALAIAPASAAMNTNAEHAVLMDGASGQVLWEKDGLTPVPPASMSKLMTLELLFQRLKDRRLKLTDTLPVSERAWSTQGSKMFVTLNSNVRVEDLIRGIVITSGNDACVVVAEGLGGTLENFVDMMNQRAKQLGLSQSHFVNPDGLPDPPGQLMSALDLGKLARHLISDYPAYYHYFSERSFTWSVAPGRAITQQNRDSVIDKFPGTDGLKTGHTDAAGYGITVSAVRNGQRLILVLNGLRYPQLDKMTPAAQDWHGVNLRGDEAARVLGVAFREFRQYPLFNANAVVGQAQVSGGSEDTVPAVVKSPVAPTLQVDSRPGLKVALHINSPLKAPVAAGQVVGALMITAPDYPGMTVPVYAAKPVSELGFFGKIVNGIESMISRKKGG
jgi:D-alanyl-D-alanine carboxypeptidase (penicillin-binding protein 5/6)